MEQRLKRLKEANLTRRGVLVFLVTFFSYLSLTLYLNSSFADVLFLLSFSPIHTGFMIFLNVVVATFLGLIINLIIFRYKEGKSLRSQAGLPSVGVVFGLIGGVCHVCFAGVLPVLLAFFGVSFSLVNLPLLGMELLILAVLLLGSSLFYLTKSNYSCEVKKRKHLNNK